MIGVNELGLTVPFPEGYGASVHFRFPDRDFLTLGVYVLLLSSTSYMFIMNLNSPTQHSIEPHIVSQTTAPQQSIVSDPSHLPQIQLIQQTSPPLSVSKSSL